MKKIKTQSNELIICSIDEPFPINRPDGILLGKLSELEDKELERFCNKYNNYAYRDYVNTKIFYPDMDTNDICLTAKESFISLLQSNGIDTSKELLIIEVL